MEQNFRPLNKKELRKVCTPALARKYDCSDVYVRAVLKGYRARNTELAQKIFKDALIIIALYEEEDKL